MQSKFVPSWLVPNFPFPSGRLSIRFGRTATAGIASHAGLFKNEFQRTKAGERGLEEVKADKGGEPEPVTAVIISQQRTGEDERAGEPADEHVHFHNGSWIGFGLTKTGRDQPAYDHTVQSADDGVACQRARAGPATGRFVPAEAENRPRRHADENPHHHQKPFPRII